jgi:hypothetical protein
MLSLGGAAELPNHPPVRWPGAYACAWPTCLLCVARAATGHSARPAWLRLCAPRLAAVPQQAPAGYGAATQAVMGLESCRWQDCNPKPSPLRACAVRR